MLLSLQIENYAVIDQAALEFGAGLNVLSGETGSGKSIVVDALSLLLGRRADAQVVRQGAEKASIHGAFMLEDAAGAAAMLSQQGIAADADEPLIIRRELNAGGKSRAFINAQPATLAQLRELAPWLAAIQSQNEALVAFQPATELAYLDRYAQLESELDALAEAHETWRKARQHVEELASADRQRLQELDLWNFQWQELQAARLAAGEDAELELEHRRLANAGKILEIAQSAYNTLYDSPSAAAADLKSAERDLQELARLDPGCEALPPRLASLRSELADIAESLRAWTEESEASTERLAQIEERLSLLDRLKRKYGPSLEEVLVWRDQLAEKLEAAVHADERLAAAQAEVQHAAEAYARRAEAASRRRHQAAPRLARAVEQQAKAMAMPLRLEITLNSRDEPEGWTAAGYDTAAFQGTLNPGEPLRELADCASGGELSRLLLALQVAIEENGRRDSAGAREGARTLVFDEIDAGIGGQAAETVGRKLSGLARHWQLLCVTHLAQIATFADHHLQVEKQVRQGRAFTVVRKLTGAERVEEIARMLAGKSQDPTARRHAAELLAAAHAGR